MQVICVISVFISLLYVTVAWLVWIDIVDNLSNQINLIVIGVLECIAVGWCFDTDKVLAEVNRNTTKFQMKRGWFRVSIRYIAPVVLTVLFVWNIYSLFALKGGHYGYALWAELIAGWFVSILVFVSGFFVRLAINHKKKKGFQEEVLVWDEKYN